MNKILVGDCLIKLKELEDNSVDSIVTDPPYELGFMGKSWDNTGIANNVEMWRECLRVLKPGGHLLAFSGTRTYHRMASAIEDAGFEVRDMIEWVYGSGFPKSLNIGKAVDKLQGNEREVVEHIFPDGSKPRKTQHIDFYTENEGIKGGAKYTKGTSEWEGWGTALKPAHEPICMARKPLEEKTVAENCLKWGTGGINIDWSRVEYQGEADFNSCGWSKMEATGKKQSDGEHRPTQTLKNIGDFRDINKGRFPANLLHDNSEEVRECFPESKSSDAIRHNKKDNFKFFSEGEKQQAVTSFGFNDSGNASRFFKSIIYQAKSSKSDRTSNGSVVNTHPTVKSVALMTYLIKMVTPKGGVVLDPFAGSGSTLVAAKQNGFQYIGIEFTEEYIPIIEARLK